MVSKLAFRNAGEVLYYAQENLSPDKEIFMQHNPRQRCMEYRMRDKHFRRLYVVSMTFLTHAQPWVLKEVGKRVAEQFKRPPSKKPSEGT